MNGELKAQLRQLAQAARILASHGHEDVTQGHVTLRDPEGRGIWMKRRGIGLSEVHGKNDFLLVDWDGKVLEGDGERHGEWPIHTEVMLARPDIHAGLHSHPPHATLFTTGDAPFLKITQDGMRLGPGPIPLFEATADLLVTRDQGKALAAALGASNIVFMKNHGVSVFAANIPVLTLTGVFLERAAKALLLARSAGLNPGVPPLGDAQNVIASLDTPGFVSDNWAYLLRELERNEQS